MRKNIAKFIALLIVLLVSANLKEPVSASKSARIPTKGPELTATATATSTYPPVPTEPPEDAPFITLTLTPTQQMTPTWAYPPPQTGMTATKAFYPAPGIGGTGPTAHPQVAGQPEEGIPPANEKAPRSPGGILKGLLQAIICWFKLGR